MLELIITLCLSTISAGLYLRVHTRTMLPAAVAAPALGIAAFLFGRSVLPLWACFVIGIAVPAIWFPLREKRFFTDGLLTFCIGGCLFGCWSVFRSGLKSVAQDDLVLFLYSIFYLLHIPAILLSFGNFRLLKDWQRNAKLRQNILIPTVCAVAMLLIGAVMFLLEAPLWEGILRIALVTSVLWMTLSISVLLLMHAGKEAKSTAQETYHSEMNTFMNVVRSQRHDYNLHVQTVASLIAQEKWNDCRSYVNALVQDTNTMNEVLPVRDPAVAALIHNYRILAAQNGIDLQLDIRDDMADVVTDAYETNKIVGNLLQNALDEVTQHPTPEKIELGIFKRGEYCMVRVTNEVEDGTAFAARLNDIFRQGFTTKQGHDGVGLSSIRSLAKSIGGDVTAWVEGNTVHFVASIPIRLNMN